MNFAISGATGKLGRLVVNKLADKISTENIFALARNPSAADNLVVPVRQADYSRPETLDQALHNVNTFLLISSSEVGQRVLQHKNAIEAAKRAGVKWIVYTSLLHADVSPLSLAAEHLETETALKVSGMPFTILRNGWYTENYTGSIPGALAGGAFIGSAGEGKISSATRVDYAEATVAVLIGDGHVGKTYELAGDEAYTLSELAAEISLRTGKHIPYRNLPESEYAVALANFGLPEPLAKAIAGYDIGASHGALFDDNRQMSTLLDRPTTPVSVAVTDAIGQ